MKLSKLLISLFSLLFAGYISAQTKLWVSPNGNGTSFSEISPGSLTEVSLNEKIKSLRNVGVKNIEVYLLPGVYPLSQPITIDRNIAGAATDTLSFIGSEASKATLSGGKKVSGWQYAGNGIYKTQLPLGTDFRQLYINGRSAVKARTPNRNSDESYGPYLRIKNFVADASKNEGLDNHKMVINASEISNWSNMQNVEMVINQHWVHNRIKVSSFSISGANAIVNLAWALVYWQKENLAYYWENSLDFLDQAGEWFLDKKTGVLYYKPLAEEYMNTIEAVYPAMDRLLSIGGTSAAPVQNVFIRNIEFMYSNWTTPSNVDGFRANLAVQPLEGSITVESMIQVNYANNVRFSNCNIIAAGGHGLTFATGVKNSEIEACRFDRICADGIVINTANNPNPTEENACNDNRVAHNLIENVAMNYTNGVGLLTGTVARLTVENNEIRFGGYGGMNIEGGDGNNVSGLHDNTIRNNHVHHVMRVHDDCGGIYTYARQDGTRIYNNYVHDIQRGAWAENYAVAGIYLDNHGSYITVEDNVLIRNAIDVNQQISSGLQAHDNIIRNNVAQDPVIEANSGPQMITGVRSSLTGLISPESPENKLKVYPNPVDISLTVENAKWKDSSFITLYNVNGIKVRMYPVAGLKTAINTNDIPVGIYIVEAGKQTTTIIKKAIPAY
jgi:hypothetical protein